MTKVRSLIFSCFSAKNIVGNNLLLCRFDFFLADFAIDEPGNDLSRHLDELPCLAWRRHPANLKKHRKLA